MRWRDALPELLFFGGNTYESFEHRKAEARRTIVGLDREEVVGGNADEIVAKIVSRHALSVPTLHEDHKHAEREEIKVDVSQDPNRLIIDRSRPHEIDAMRITIWVPFDGDSDLFRLQPSTFNFNPPRGEISGKEVGFVFVDPNPTSEKINAEFSSWLADVKQHLSWHQPEVAKFNTNLAGIARQDITARQQKLSTTENLLAGLNIPLKNKAASVPSKTPAPHREARAREQYDCFVSYAGEDRALVLTLVGALQGMGVRVWWDKGQITLGDKLSQKIDEGLRLSQYGLVIISDAFIAKRWPEAELRALAHRAINSGSKVLLPVLVGMEHSGFASAYPLLADIVSTTYRGDPEALATEVMEAIRPITPP
jgi:hypothetical protein